MFELGKLSLIIITRCNLRCKLCCEYVPQNKPFPDMTAEEERKILTAAFEVCDHIKTLHLTGGGEPFLHPHLKELIEEAMNFSDKFDTLMLFTNSTVNISGELLDTLVKHKDKILVQLSHYGINREREESVTKLLTDSGIRCKVEKYYGEEQSFGGWVDFGHWESYGRSEQEIGKTFADCSVTSVLKGNWRTRDGKVHWCTRSQRGMELGLLPDDPEDYVDLLGSMSAEEKREKFRRIEKRGRISACDHCSGDLATSESRTRYPAAEQEDK